MTLHVTLRSNSHLSYQRIVQLQHHYSIHANLIIIMYVKYVGVTKKKFEDTKGTIRSRIPYDRRYNMYNGQKKKKENNDLQSTTK